MKKNILGFVIIMMMAVMLSACGNNDSKVNQVMQDQMQEADNKNNQSDETEVTDENKPSEAVDELQEKTTTEDSKPEDNKPESGLEDAIDVDLTKLSSTMVYSEVYNMMYTPEDYIGKTVKMSGMFVAYTNQDQSQFYPAVIIADATACCSQGLEFVLEGNPSYPEGYPEMETEITVVGTFETYEEEGNTYCRLQNAKIE